MPRVPRVYVEGALYYVTSRGDHSQAIFRDEEDYRAYIELLKKYKQQYGFKLFSFTLLSNHLHLLIELKEDVTISEIMHDLNSSYIKYFNNRHNRKGHLLQERFKLSLIEKQAYLLYMTAYIHLNSCRLGLVKQAGEYAYSSYLNYTGFRLQDSGSRLQDSGSRLLQAAGINIEDEVREVLEGTGYRAQATGKNGYEDVVRDISEGKGQILAEKLHKGRILGSQEFKEKVRRQLVKDKLQAKEEKPRVNKRFVLVGSLAVLVLGIMAVYLFRVNLGLRDRFKTTLQTKQIRLEQKINIEKEKIKRELKERYAADRVSYEAMARRLKIEKEKAGELEEKLKGVKQE